MRAPVAVLVFLAFCLMVLAGCNSDQGQLPTISTKNKFTKEGTLDFLRPDGHVAQTIDIEIAETDQERATGLMTRRSLPHNSGMLFLDTKADTTGFWMKNTPLPLDIIFVGPDSQVVSIAKHTVPFSEKVLYPAAPKQYVVEVRAGMADRWGVDRSTKIRWRRE